MSVVLVSNRVALAGGNGSVQGGVAAALARAVEKRGALWLGWSGNLFKDEVGHALPSLSAAGLGTIATVDLPERHFSGYYNSMANSALWPLLHSRSDLLTFEESALASYESVNEFMARAVLRVAPRSLAGEPLPPPLPLAPGLPIAAGQKLYLVAYPARDLQLDDTFAVSVYGGVYDVKRVSCGRMLALSDRQVIHDCFTAPGSSGAPLMDLESGRVVGVHLVNSPGEGRIALNVTSKPARALLAALGLGASAE